MMRMGERWREREREREREKEKDTLQRDWASVGFGGFLIRVSDSGFGDVQHFNTTGLLL